ncbi:MAG: hypothetical protein FVQ82_14740 [Planctomycetes bacterium]|nr:hypothetical protein [Planctomycetota bacterium]
MSNKDINIHIKTPGADQSKQNLDKVGKSGKHVGDDIASGSKKAASATEKSAKKLSSMGRILSTLKGQVVGMVGAWLGMEGVKKLINYFIDKLERIKKLQEDIYQKSLTLGEIGQDLEMQTDTVGQQREWTKKTLEVQKAGGLKDPATAKDMLVSMDIALKGQGGIKNPAVMNLAKDLAPFMGATQMGSDEVGRLFGFATTAGVAPTAKAYRQYFAKIKAGYTSSESTDIGQFMSNLQRGGTAYMGQGGSLNEAISAFASARSVTANESTAATLLEQVARFSSGAYAKPRQAVEKSQGVKWENMNMDQRMDALLGHIKMLPESSRTQTMIEQGFEPGLATEVQKMVTPKAISAMRSTRRSVGQATTSLTGRQMQAYLDSDVGKARSLDAEKSLMDIEAGPGFAAWQRRISKSKKEHEILASKGQDSWVRDSLEPYVMALDEMNQQAKELLENLPKGEERYRVKSLLSSIHQVRNVLRNNAVNKLYSPGLANKRGQQLESHYREVLELITQYKQPQPEEQPQAQQPQAQQPQPEEQPQAQQPQAQQPQLGNVSNTTNIHYHQDTIFQPRIGNDGRGPRFTQESA